MRTNLAQDEGLVQDGPADDCNGACWLQFTLIGVVLGKHRILALRGMQLSKMRGQGCFAIWHAKVLASCIGALTEA